MNPPAGFQSLNRRQFLVRSAGLLGAPAFPLTALAKAELRVAAVGVGGFGYRTLTEVASHPKVVVTALCDVDPRALDRARRDFPKADHFRDWRQLLAEASDRFDALVVCPPDHMHAPVAVSAMRAKKHVYVQKPLAATVHECRVMREEAEKQGVVTQLGNQRRSSLEDRTTVELLRRGTIGKVKEVILWENKPLNWWPKTTQRKGQSDPLPEGFDWDLWLGVREARPYLEGAYHPMSWRAWLDFGTGELGDMGCHHFDCTLDGLGLSTPRRIRQNTESRSPELWGERREVEFEFVGTEYTAGDSLRMTWYDGDLKPDASRLPLPPGMTALPESGAVWLGEEGSLFKSFRGGQPIVIEGRRPVAGKNPFDLPEQHHYHDWVDAILSGGRTVSHFQHGALLSETVLVGALADRFPQRWLEWDAESMAFRDLPEANALLRRRYREGWSIPGLG